MTRYFFILLALFSLAGAPQAVAADKKEAGDGVIGTILEVEGSGTVTSKGKAYKAAVETPIRLNDIVSTDAKSRIFILFIDETQFTLSEKTKLTVNKYVFDPDNAKNNKASFNVIDGAFEYVSGLLAKRPDPEVNIITNYGSIGVRGTKFWGGRIRDNYGVHVTDGRVRVKNDGGEVLVNKGQGTFVKNKQAKPTNAAPFPPEALEFIQGSIFMMIGQQGILNRIGGFSGKNMMLRNQFQQFQQLQGILPIPGGGNIPGMPGGFPFPGQDQAPQPQPKKGTQKQKQNAPNPGEMLKLFGR